MAVRGGKRMLFELERKLMTSEEIAWTSEECNCPKLKTLCLHEEKKTY